MSNRDHPGTPYRDPRRDRRLAELIADAVSDVEPGDRLDTIRTRTKVTPMSTRRPWLFGAGGAAIAVAATVVAFAVLGNTTGNDREPDQASSPGSPTSAAEPSPSGSSTTDGSGSAEPSPSSGGRAAAVPVYYVGDTPQGPRLFREFHRAVVGPERDAVVDAAVSDAVTGAPLDPDYRSPWPAGTTAAVDVSADLVTVDLSGSSALHDRPAGLSAAEAGMAVEQLIYSAHAGLAAAAYPALSTAPDRTPVQFLLDGRRTDQLLGVPASEPLAAGAQLDVLAMVSLTTPAQGDRVGNTLAVEGRASSFEANVPWELRQGSRVVDRGFFTAEGFMDRLYPFAGTVDLSGMAPGRYTFVAMTDDPSDGEGGGPTEDTKTILVDPS